MSLAMFTTQWSRLHMEQVHKDERCDDTEDGRVARG
jgi:hypothetical protein